MMRHHRWFDTHSPAIVQERTVVVDPRPYVGRYDSNGELGGPQQQDQGVFGYWPYRRVGSFRVYSLVVRLQPFSGTTRRAPMPLLFSMVAAIHGSPPSHVQATGWLRARAGRDAEWLRYNFVNVGTRVIVRPY